MMKRYFTKGIITNPLISRLRVLGCMLLHSPEGRIFLFGISIVLVFFAWFLSPYHYDHLNTLVAARLFLGRPGSIYFGKIFAFHYMEILCINILFDTTAVFIIYPLLVFSSRAWLELQFFRKTVVRIMRIARQHHDEIQKYGKFGLFLFVLFPVWGTGPVVGSAIGFLMGLNPGCIIALVLSAAYLTIFLLICLISGLHVWSLSWGFHAPLIVLGLFILWIIYSYFKRCFNRRESSCG